MTTQTAWNDPWPVVAAGRAFRQCLPAAGTCGLTMIMLWLAVPVSLFAQPGQQSRATNSPRDAILMLSNPQVQNELMLTDDQQLELRRLQAAFGTQISHHLQQLGTSGLDHKEQEALRGAIREAESQRRQKMKAVLLPFQLERLKQVALQMKMRSLGDVETLTDPEIAEMLGISDAQKRRIRNRAEQIEAEMEQEIARIKQQAREKLLDELTPDQRRQFEEMLGNEFEDSSVVDLKKRLRRGK